MQNRQICGQFFEPLYTGGEWNRCASIEKTYSSIEADMSWATDSKDSAMKCPNQLSDEADTSGAIEEQWGQLRQAKEAVTGIRTHQGCSRAREEPTTRGCRQVKHPVQWRHWERAEGDGQCWAQFQVQNRWRQWPHMMESAVGARRMSTSSR